MVYINGKILFSNNGRIKLNLPKGSMLLSRWEVDALKTMGLFSHLMYHWASRSAVTHDALPFTLTVTCCEDTSVYECKFVDHSPFLFGPQDEEMGWVEFEILGDDDEVRYACQCCNQAEARL